MKKSWKNRIAFAWIIFAVFNTSLLGKQSEQMDTASRIPIQISGVYPHLNMWNDENECGTGALVPWQEDLWAVTYAPHAPNGSSDKLYRISPDFKQLVLPVSVGGTPANRMIHRESNQLLIGPYLIDRAKNVRVIPPFKMYGRLTGNARHLNSPQNKVYYATMEEGLYSVDVNSLAVETLIRDGNRMAPKKGIRSQLPGYHGKGLYSGQGRLVYSNNGEHGADAKRDPTVSSGALAQWQPGKDWSLVRRNQFTEVTGPGGIYGNENPESDPIWSLGWDSRSVILALFENQEWSYYRLPKASHSYDGAHGWNTEWPRIREIGSADPNEFLATMHGTFWRFPKSFSRNDSAGISPRSNYLKVVGDFCFWNGQVVLGCDDSARAEFLNTRTFKAKHAAAKQSNSNLWFVDGETLDRLGPVIGRGSVWLRENVVAGSPSDPYLFSGYDFRQLHLTHEGSQPVTVALEVDRVGDNTWQTLAELEIPAGGDVSHLFSKDEKGVWIRLKSKSDLVGVSAHFQYRNRDLRTPENGGIFKGIVSRRTSGTRLGLMRSLAYNRLGLVAVAADGSEKRYYELDLSMKWVRVDDPEALVELEGAVEQPPKSYSTDAASVIIEEDGNRFRLPMRLSDTGVSELDRNHSKKQSGFGRARVCREVATERDLLNIHGTFYELPARNAQGLSKLRPIATHNLDIHDFCSHAGLFLMTGIDESSDNGHIFRSDDGFAAVWAGVVDDLWKLGKPRGKGGPWRNTAVEANQYSDPYLMTGYDKKQVSLRSSVDATIRLEVDVDGTGLWISYRSFRLKSNQTVHHEFPKGFSAYWVRAISDSKSTATVQFDYR